MLKTNCAWLCVALTGSIGLGVAAYTVTANEARQASEPHAIILAQLSPQQAAQCQQEAAQLNAQLAHCTNDACRQQVQAAVASHNARCSG